MLDRIKKKQLVGFKEFVQNMEITGREKRNQILISGLLEDPVYMEWVMRNLKTFDDFLKLPGEDILAVLNSHEQILSVFAKCLFPDPVSKYEGLESTVAPISNRLRDEVSYLKEVTPGEKESARYYIVKATRKLSTAETINGFPWKLPSMEIFYTKTFKDGLAEIKFENGVVAAQGTFLKNRRLGAWKHFYETGAVLAEGEYSEGLKIGPWHFYYANGNPKSQGIYHHDQKQGKWKEFARDGSVTESYYNLGVKED